MKLGIFAKTFSGNTPLDVLSAAKHAGYSAVQYNMACSGIGSLPTTIAPEIARAVKDASTATGVEISAISATYNMTHPDILTREAGRRSFATIAATAHMMGTNLLTVCSGSLDAQDQWRHHPDNNTDAAWADMMAEFRFLVEIAEEHNVLIGVEPELANIVSSAGKARRLINAIGSERIRIVLDPANLFETGSAEDRRDTIAAAVDLLADKIIMAHAKDRNADGSFATAGKGVVDFPHFLNRLAVSGFKGALVTHGLTAYEAPRVAQYFHDILDRQDKPA